MVRAINEDDGRVDKFILLTSELAQRLELTNRS